MKSVDWKMQSSTFERGLHFLYSKRNRSGWWLDFRTSEGISDEWVTAYTGWCLSQIEAPPAGQLAHAAWARLRKRRWWLSGWAYNYGVPLDADSTIWAIRLAESLHATNRRITRAYRFLKSHTHPGGGLSTYSRRSRIARHIHLPARLSAIGWQSPHVCVSAAAANLAQAHQFPALNQFLIRQQEAAGNWTGYWWSDAAFPTAMAVNALSGINAAAYRESIEAGIAWLLAQLQHGPVRTSKHPDGSPFATAAALTGLLHARQNPAVDEIIIETVRWLIAQQQADGAWASSARLRLPPPDVVRVADVTHWKYTHDFDAATIKFDQNRIFTTATVLFALAAARSRTTA